jgi:hypothetical protein
MKRNFLQANMKTILSVVLVLGFCGLAFAQGEKADPVGTWKCEYTIGDQVLNASPKLAAKHIDRGQAFDLCDSLLPSQIGRKLRIAQIASLTLS